MAIKHEIEIIISPDGEVKLDVKGMKGSGCLLEVKRLAEVLGELKGTDLKPEYYETTTQAQAQKKLGS